VLLPEEVMGKKGQEHHPERGSLYSLRIVSEGFFFIKQKIDMSIFTSENALRAP